MVFGIAIVIVVLLAVALFTLRNFGRRILVALPFPQRIVEFYDRFEQGVFGALNRRQLPGLALLSIAIWMTEAMRLFFVVKAFGFADVELGISGAVFVALIGSLLTAVPLSPAGLGIVEAGIVGILTLVYGVPLPEATAIALLDRVISVFSVIVLGSILYAVSGKPRGKGIAHRAEAPSPSRLSRSRRAGPGPHPPNGLRPDRTRRHHTPRACRRGRTTHEYQRVVGRMHHALDTAVIPRKSRGDLAQSEHDDRQRPRIQRVAPSPAQGQEDVAAPAGPAVGC